MYDKPRFLHCGDTAITVEIDDVINENTNSMVIELSDYIKDCNLDGIIEVVPTYRSFTVFYNPINFVLSDFIKLVEVKFDRGIVSKEKRNNCIEIPVLYGGEFGFDLERVAEHAGLTTEEVITIHSGSEYLVYMLGFTPGFPYLGGMDNAISTPRLKDPRQSVPVGSVGIAGEQTGIYPLTSPGGWNIIGRTPLRLFDSKKDKPTLLKAGDIIKFVPIDIHRYEELLNTQGEF